MNKPKKGEERHVSVPKEPTRRQAGKRNAQPEPLHKERFEQLLDDAIGAKKKAN